MIQKAIKEKYVQKQLISFGGKIIRTAIVRVLTPRGLPRLLTAPGNPTQCSHNSSAAVHLVQTFRKYRQACSSNITSWNRAKLQNSKVKV